MSEPTLSAAAPGTAQPPDAIGQDGFAELYRMSLSDDAHERTTATTLAKKLTPAEGAQFFQFQKSMNTAAGHDDLHREDNSLLGMPPEMIATAGVGMARAAVGAAASGASAAMAAARSAAGSAAPVLKYELTRTTLRAMGVPAVAASMIGAVVSGWKGGAKGEAAAAEDATRLTGEKPPTPMEAPRDLTNRLRDEHFAKAGGIDAAKAKTSAELEALRAEIAARRETAAGNTPPQPLPPAPSIPTPAAAPVVGPPVPPASAPTAPKFPMQKALNDLALAARRAKLTLTPELEQAGIEQMQQGAPADQVVAALQRVTAAKERIPAADLAAYLKLRQAGKSGEEATATIAAMRTLRSRFSLPTADNVKTSFQQLYERGQKTAPHE